MAQFFHKSSIINTAQICLDDIKNFNGHQRLPLCFGTVMEYLFFIARNTYRNSLQENLCVSSDTIKFGTKTYCNFDALQSGKLLKIIFCTAVFINQALHGVDSIMHNSSFQLFSRLLGIHLHNHHRA